MPDQLLSPKHKWPRWTWRDSGWWFAVFGAVLGAVVFVQPAISRHSFWVRFGISLGWFALSCILLLTVEHLFKSCLVAISRLRAYNSLYDVAEQQARQIARAQETILELSQELTRGRRFEIEKTLYYDETLYVVLRKKRGARLEVGHRVRVIDTQDGGIMGVFEVNEVRSDEYRARADYVNPVWLGFVHQNGRAETSAPPNTIAFLMLGDQDND